MEAISSSKAPVDTQRTTRRYIPEDGTLQYEVCLRNEANHSRLTRRPFLRLYVNNKTPAP
jgi:hypothetical protein